MLLWATLLAIATRLAQQNLMELQCRRVPATATKVVTTILSRPLSEKDPVTDTKLAAVTLPQLLLENCLATMISLAPTTGAISWSVTSLAMATTLVERSPEI